MSRDKDKLIRQLSLISFLLSRPRPFSAREIHEAVEGYAEMSDETFTRRFHADRADLAEAGIQIRVLRGPDTGSPAENQLYTLTEEDFRLPAVDFTPAEVQALSLALTALDGRFAYARPLRMALTAILHGQPAPAYGGVERLPVALAPDEDAHRAAPQLGRLEEAVTRGKTVRFSYSGSDGVLRERTLDPYGLYLIQSRWYVVGRDHLRDAVRMFRLGRIQGNVRFLTEKTRDFSIPADFDPAQYRARPPWLIGAGRGTALVKVGGDLTWWVERLRPHATRVADGAEGGAVFAMPFADESVLLSWVAGLGGRAELLEPAALRLRLREALVRICAAHEEEAAEDQSPGAADLDGPQAARGGLDRQKPPAPLRQAKPEEVPRVIAPEHIARAITLLYYLVDETRPSLITWQALEDDLGLTRGEVEKDLSLINLVNYGGGTYALTAEAGPDGVRVVREVMADTFAHPARLSPVMARALLLALDLLGDTIALEGLESLSSVRDKVREAIGSEGKDGSVIVDEVFRPDPAIVEVLNHAIRDHSLVALEYYSASRQQLAERLVEPYLLFHSPEGWYVEAYCLKAREQRTFKLDRIRAARNTGETFAPRADIDLTRPRAGQAFVSLETPGWASVCFQPRWRTYLEDSGWEYAYRADGSLVARLPYVDERWLAQQVIRFLGDAVVESPASARRTVGEVAHGLLARYQDDCPPAGGAARAEGPA